MKISVALHFVFRACDLKSSTIDNAQRTGTRAVCDVSWSVGSPFSHLLQRPQIAEGVTDLKIAASDLMDPRLISLIQSCGIERMWVELHPTLLQRPLVDYLGRIVELSSGAFSLVPIIGSLDVFDCISREYPQIEQVALKGNEASGFVGSETLLTLYTSVREMTRERGHGPELCVWGGLSTPEAVAAFFCTGAKGVVFENLHWLTDDVACNGQLRSRLTDLRPDHTELIGLNSGIACRLFNKGNSLAIKELKACAMSDEGSAAGAGFEHSIAGRINGALIHPMDSRFSREELIPIGVEASFAAPFVSRYGSDAAQAIDLFVKDIERCCANAPHLKGAFSDSPVAKGLGTRYPFIQGGMSCITDVPEFARKVADAGGLPTIALGLMDERLLKEKLGRLPEIMGSLPYAVNVITLPENPHREAQLSWVGKIRPRFVVIAAGEPIHGKELLASGLEVIYVTSSSDLLKLAFEMGIRFAVCEGHEAGGHVGGHSTLTLAQDVIDLKRANPSLFKDRRLILAGGICNRETAFIAAMLGADAIQMGTAYLATEEIVGTGALTSLYQQMILSSQPGSTVVTGKKTGLRIRSLRTDKTDAILSLERQFASGLCDESSFRCEIEALAARSLLIAAKGLESPGGVLLDHRQCLSQGQFMSGTCAGIITKVKSLKELHREIAEGAFASASHAGNGERKSPVREHPGVERAESPAGRMARSEIRMAATPGNGRMRERIAITGMSASNSLGKSPEDIWAASLAMKSGITTVPLSRWDHNQHFHPKPGVAEKTYCTVGAFQEFNVSRKEVGFAPQDFHTMSYATRLTLWLASRAVEASGILAAGVPPERVAVLISQNSGEVASTLKDITIRGSIAEIVAAVKRVVPLAPEMQEAVAREITAGRLAVDDTTLLGRLNCAAAGFVCNRYGFMGPSYSVSAACSTSLAALFTAVQMMRNGIIDAAAVGGGEELLTPMHFIEFSALGALAGFSGVERPPAETSRPFDRGRDGMVLGEGGGMIIVELESLARKRGAKIYGFITAIGACNSPTSMIDSARKAQEHAIQASFAGAGYGPDMVDMVECHATGTRQGDIEEIEALGTIFGPHKRTVLTSFKSQIGHTLGASGMISLIRGISAMNAGIFPPVLNCSDPDPRLKLDGLGLGICREPAEWKSKTGGPKRFQVNAFGFGGSNYVVQLEQSRADEDIILVSVPDSDGLTSSRDGANREEEVALPKGVHLYNVEGANETYRIAVVADSEETADSMVDGSGVRRHEGSMTAKKIRSLARQGLHLGSALAPIPPAAFVFPGQGTQYGGMGYELYLEVPAIRQSIDRAQRVAEFDLLRLLFHESEENLQETRWQQPALFALEFAIGDYLLSLGIIPKAMAGHSLGELSALCLAGVYSFEDGFHIVDKRAVCMEAAGAGNTEPGAMMATDAPVGLLEELIAREGQVYITNFNSPRQTVVGGSVQSIAAFGVHLGELGFRCTTLPVSMAFHSPLMRSIHDELAAFIKDIPFHPPAIPVISNTTRLPFPPNTAEIKQIMMTHLECPVYWEQNVQFLRSAFGIGTFIEVGPRDILGSMISDISEEADCIKTCMPSAEILVLRNALAQLFGRGYLNRRSKRLSTAVTKTAARPLEAPPPATPDCRPSLALQTSDKLRDIVQKEINSFVLKCFGHFLRPRLLETIRKECDARFDEQDLDGFLKQIYPVAQLPGLPPGGADEKSAAFPVPTTSQTGDVAPELPERSSLGPEEVMEAVIEVIMQATGYDRDEIEPHMDLREDLSIRSSRLPVVMDALEGRFGTRIDIQDFIGVRTIRDVSEKVSTLVARGGGGPHSAVEDPRGAGAPDQPHASDSSGEISRVVFRETVLESFESRPICISPPGSVAVLSTSGERSIGKEVGDILRRDYGVDVEQLTFLSPAMGSNSDNNDLRTAQGRSHLIETIKGLESLAGLVLIVDNSTGSHLAGIEETFSLLCGFFELLNTILKSPAMKFVTVIDTSKEGHLHTSPLVEGILGTFLCAAIEYDKMLFRVVRLERESELRDAVRTALNISIKPVELIYRGGRAFTTEGRVSPSAFRNPDDPNIGPGDVVICSGGGSGITPFLLRGFIPFGCRLVLLGRTEVEPISLDQAHLSSGLASGEPGTGPFDVREGKTSGPDRCSEIRRTVEALNRAGLETNYVRCDVTDPEQTRKVVRDIAARFGKISGIVHGAGIIRDAFIHRMSPDDFSTVAGVKLLGAWNLFHAARSAGLKFFACLSSAASIQGNPGQANYSAGNRAMSALMSSLRRDEPSITFKALILPPLSGAGMADNPEVRALLERTKTSYVDVEELAALFPQELLIAPPDEVKVMFMRSLPELSTAPRIVQDDDLARNTLQAGITGFKPEELPMLDTISTIDRREMTLIASRSFSQQKDLWLPEHKPFKRMEYPLLSAIMVLEMMMEAARALFPHLNVRGIRGAQFLYPVECPRGDDISCEVSCRCVKFEAEEIVCDASLTASDPSSASSNWKRSIPNFRASVLLGGSLPSRFELLDGFPVSREELDNRSMDSEQVRMFYRQGTDLKGRYRVIESVDGASPDAIRARMTYTEGNDFSTFSGVSYQYSPYLLEGLLHILNFHSAMRDKSEARSMIPCGIAEMIFVRKCAEGESFALEARLRERTDQGNIWDARALDEGGNTVMLARRIDMRWC